MSYIHLVNNLNYHYRKAGLIVSLFFIVALLSACNDQGKVWAKVNDITLYENDALLLMKHLGYDINKTEDKKKFTQQWIDRIVCIQELQQTHSELAHKSALAMLWNQGELAQFHLEDEYIKNTITTHITDSTIQRYYEQHKDDFSLNDYLVRALYIKVPKDAPKQDQIKESYLLKKDKDYSKVISYAKLYADNFYYNDSTWVYFDELTKDVPTEKLNKDNLVLNRVKTYFSDEEYFYYLNIIDYKLKNAVPPLDFLRPTIKQLIVNQKLSEIKGRNSATFLKKIKEKHEIISHY